MDSNSSLVLILCLILSLIYLIYRYSIRNYNYWSKQGIKGPNPLPVFGNILDLFITPQPLALVKWFNKYGKIFGYYFGSKPILSIADPELIKAIMVTDFHVFTDRNKYAQIIFDNEKTLVDVTGDDWKRIRSIVTPTFTPTKIKKMYSIIGNCMKEFMDVLDMYATEGKEINTKDMFGNFSMDVIATCAFAVKTNPHQSSNNPFIINAKQMLNINIVKMILMLILPQSLLALLNIRGALDSIEFFKDSTRLIIERRRQSNVDEFNDFLQLLMDSEMGKELSYESNDANESFNLIEGADELAVKRKTLTINVVNRQLSEGEVLAQALTFFLGGYETTSTALIFASYELALNPSVQQRLYEEVNAAMGANGQISYEELAQLKYLDAVLCEALRLHPPVVFLQLLASTDYQLGDTGITVRKGQQIEIPVYAIHRSEEFFENALEFRPERFLPENRHKIRPCTYLPFGVGPRNCVGMRFGLIETKLCLAQVVYKYKFFRSKQTSVPLKYKRSFIINRPENVTLGIAKRV